MTIFRNVSRGRMRAGGPLSAKSLSLMAAGGVMASVLACLASTLPANAQARLALKSGETLELGAIYYVSRCKSTMIGAPEIEMLEGPEEIKLTYKEEMVLPRAQSCANRVPGGKLFLSATDIKESGHATLTYRVKYKTKDGPRQSSATYHVLLYP